MAGGRKLPFFNAFFFFLNSWFICLLNYLFAFPLQSSFDCLTWKYGCKADDEPESSPFLFPSLRSLPRAAALYC